MASHEFIEDERKDFNKIYKKYFNVSFEIRIIDIFCCTTIFLSALASVSTNYVPHEMGRHVVLAPLSVRPSVCPSVRPSVCLAVCHTFVSAPYLLNPWWDSQITLHKCQVWWDNVQCLCFTKVGSRSQGHNLRLNIVWLYFVSALYHLKPLWVLQITLHKCLVWWDHLQCQCLTKVGSRSRPQSKIKQCMTVFRIRSLSFKPLVGFTNNFAQMSSMMRQCAVLRFHQGRFKVQVTISDQTLYDCFSCPLYIFWTPGGIYTFTHNCTNVKYDETICKAYIWPRSVQSQGHYLR